MPYFNAVLSTQEHNPDGYALGEVVSVHQDYVAALTQAQKLQKRHCERFHMHGSFYVALTSTEPLKKGQILVELLNQHEQAQRRAFHKQLMSAILSLELTGKPGGQLAAEAGHYLQQEGLTLDELHERYAEEVREEHRAQVLQEQEFAHRRARGFELQQEVAARSSEFCYSFAAVRGIQAGHEYYSAMIPFRILDKLFVTDDDDQVAAELRAQRQLNPKRAAAIGDYILENPDTYVLPALTASVDQRMVFEPLAEAPHLGTLHIPMGAAILINDGQHRRHGIGRAIQADPTLEKESIAVQIHFDQGLERAQQMFADINTKQVKPSSTLNALYDRRNPFNAWTLELLRQLPEVQRRIDFENSVPGVRSYRLWSLVAFSKFLTNLTGVSQKTIGQVDAQRLLAIAAFVAQFLEACGEHLPQWQAMLQGKIAAYDVREQFVIGHAVFLEALGIFGRQALLAGTAMTVAERDAKVVDPERAMWVRLAKLKNVDPHKTSPLWERRCVHQGKMMKTTTGIKSTAAQLLRLADVDMPDDLAKIDALITVG